MNAEKSTGAHPKNLCTDGQAHHFVLSSSEDPFRSGLKRHVCSKCGTPALLMMEVLRFGIFPVRFFF